MTHFLSIFKYLNFFNIHATYHHFIMSFIINLYISTVRGGGERAELSDKSRDGLNNDFA